MPAVVFDLDGVLVASEGLWDAVRRGLVAETGRSWPAAATRAIAGHGHRGVVGVPDRLIGAPGRPEEVAATVIAGMSDRYRSWLPLLPGAVEVVERLASRWPLGLASPSPRRLVDAVLASAGLTGRFRVTESPRPRPYREAVRRLGRGRSASGGSGGLEQRAAIGCAGRRCASSPYPTLPFRRPRTRSRSPPLSSFRSTTSPHSRSRRCAGRPPSRREVRSPREE